MLRRNVGKSTGRSIYNLPIAVFIQVIVAKNDVTKLPVVLTLPGMEEVSVQHAVYFEDASGPLEMDIYFPPGAAGSVARLPVVILVTGHADPNIEAALGCRLKDSQAYISWARLLALSGIVAVTYANRSPADDVISLVGYLQNHSTSLSMDLDRVGLWSCSANVPNALALMISRRVSIRCAAFLYGFMLDRADTSHVADAAALSGFAAPNSGRTVNDIPSDASLLVIRAGADQVPGINPSIDDFCADALKLNLPLRLINHPTAPHSFDIFDHSDLTKAIIRGVLEFFEFHLRKDA